MTKNKKRKKSNRNRQRQSKLMITHIVPATPHACGMYETARELAEAERKLGVIAHIFDPRPYPHQVGDGKRRMMAKATCPDCKNEFNYVQAEQPIPTRPPDWADDRGVSIAPLAFALQSDVIVSHSGIDERFKDCPAPRIHLAHGRPNSSFRIERSGETPIYTTYSKMKDDPRWKYMVTLWPGFEHYWRVVFPHVKTFNPFVNLKTWKPADTAYDFGGLGGTPNVVVADIWRKDKDPFHVINAFTLFAKKYPTTKLHLYGMDKDGRGRDTIVKCIKNKGNLGEAKGNVRNLRDVFTSADMVITPHKMGTRIVREALACGTQVVAGLGNPYTPYTADEEDLPAYAEMMGKCWQDLKTNKESMSSFSRDTAEREFNVMDTAKQFVGLFEELTGRKVA